MVLLLLLDEGDELELELDARLEKLPPPLVLRSLLDIELLDRLEG